MGEFVKICQPWSELSSQGQRYVDMEREDSFYRHEVVM